MNSQRLIDSLACSAINIVSIKWPVLVPANNRSLHSAISNFAEIPSLTFKARLYAWLRSPTSHITMKIAIAGGGWICCSGLGSEKRETREAPRDLADSLRPGSFRNCFWRSQPRLPSSAIFFHIRNSFLSTFYYIMCKHLRAGLLRTLNSSNGYVPCVAFSRVSVT